MSAKRRLPVLQSPAAPDGPARPPWQWSLFAAGLIVLAWLLLTVLASPVSALILRANIGSWGSPDELTLRLAAASPEALGRISLETVVLQVAVLGGACVSSGLVIGVWGPGRLIAAAATAGAVVALGGVIFAALSAGQPRDAASVSSVRSVAIWGTVILVPCAAALAAAGAWVGAKRKRVLSP